MRHFKNFLLYFLLVASSLSLTLEADDDESNESEHQKKAKQAWESLTGYGGLRPLVTAHLLRQVSGTVFDTFKAEDLLEMGNITVEKCHKAYLDTFSATIKTLTPFPKTLRRYAVDCRRRQLELCKDTFDPRIDEVIRNSFSPEERQDIKLLMKKVPPPSKILGQLGYQTGPQKSAIIQGGLDFMMAKQSELIEAGGDFEWEVELWEDIEIKMTNLCRKIYKTFGGFLYINRLMRLHTLEKERSKWLYRTRVCEQVLSDMSIVAEIEQRWSELNQRKPTIARLKPSRF